MKNLLLFLLLTFPGLNQAAVLLHSEHIAGLPTQQSVSTISPTPYSSELTKGSHPSFKLKKPGLFKQFRAIKALKKQIRAQVKEGEKVSKLALIAVGIFGVSLLLLGLASSVAALVTIGLIGLIASNALSIIVLLRNDTKASNIIAMGIICTSILIIIFILLFYILALTFLLAIF